MQNERTLQFWDDFYESQEACTDKEWILQPSPPLLELLQKCMDTKGSCRILEIGCGTSALGREMRHYIQQSYRNQGNQVGSVHLLATDVSEVCIRQNQERDAGLQGVEYRVLDITQQYPDMKNSFDLILDKGCLDTFLFRSRQRGGGTKPYGQLVRTVIDNLQSWLSESGVYVILSPRHKLKTVRDYAGFSCVDRVVLDPTKLHRGDLEGAEGEPDRIYLYACRKEPSYSPDTHLAFPIEKPKPEDEDACCGCKLTFFDFRKGESVAGRGENLWFRKWRVHCDHCKPKRRVE